MAEAEMLIK